MARKPVGWRKQPARHSLAARGIKTAVKEGTAIHLSEGYIHPHDGWWKEATPPVRKGIPNHVRAYFERIYAYGDWNNFEPKRVAQYLVANRDLWSDVLPNETSAFNDVPDTIYIVPSSQADPYEHGSRPDALVMMARAMSADEVRWVRLDDGRTALRLWWD